MFSPPDIIFDQKVFIMSSVRCPYLGSVLEGGQHDCTAHLAFNPHGHIIIIFNIITQVLLATLFNIITQVLLATQLSWIVITIGCN